MAEGAAIQFEGVRRSYEGRSVLAGIDLEVSRGETVALVGANGSGKSTLIRALLDLGGVDGGRMWLNGLPHTDRRARGEIAYLPERFQPPYYLHGRGFLEYMLALYGIRPGDAPVVTVCERLGLDPRALERPVHAYSKGMAQLLGLAACLLSRRSVLVLDEPMSGLDPRARIRLGALLRERKQQGNSLFFTTHLLADAHELADRLAILHEGRIVADGPPSALMEAYGAADLQDAFVRAIDAPSTLLH